MRLSWACLPGLGVFQDSRPANNILDQYFRRRIKYSLLE